ncbi:MAG: sulfite exporter TauE/SafE family protein [Alphaproteobacteria bacterium]|nr:sulfite exporter TauE/SafE family protein [Alphaproteobacteria bacterium]
MTVTLPLAAALMSAVFVTSVLSGILGMAGGMILMGLLVWLLPVQQAMILHAIAQFFANGSRAFIHRKHIYRPSLPLYFAGMFTMFFVLAFVAFVPPKSLIYFLLGLGPFISYLLPKSLKLDFTQPKQAYGCGLIIAALQLTGGVSGGMLDMFFQTRKLTRHETVATKAFTQAVSHVLKFVYFGFVVSDFSSAAGGLPLWLCLGVIPMALMGSAASKFFLERISDAHFYRATQVVLFSIGTVYLARAVMLVLA